MSAACVQEKERQKVKKNKKNKRKKVKMTFSRKYVPFTAILSIIIAGLSVVSFVGVCIYSAYNAGEAGIAAGTVPIIAMIMNLAGFIFAYVNFKTENVKIQYVTIGAVVNAVLLILYLILYLTGI